MLLVCCVASTARAQDQHTFDVRGRVVDSEGQPAANVKVGTSWNFRGDAATPRWRSDAVARANTSLLTDETGRFRGKLYARRSTVAIFALDMAKREGGVFIFSRDDPAKVCTLKMEPLVRIHGKAVIEDTGLSDNPRYIYVTDTRARIAIASSISTDAAFSFFMPPGEYEISFSAKDLEKVTMRVLANEQHRDLDLGSVALSPTNLARHYGKPPPPWTVTAARGVSADVKLADYKGKWVLIEFWAYW